MTESEAIEILRGRVRDRLKRPEGGAIYKYDVFISYRRASSFAAILTACLRDSRHPITRKRLRVFHDIDSLGVGQNINVALNEAVKASACFIILLTPLYSKSEYTAFESILISSIDSGGLEERIFPVKLDHCEIPDRLAVINYLDITPVTAKSSPVNTTSSPASASPLYPSDNIRVSETASSKLNIGRITALASSSLNFSLKVLLIFLNIALPVSLVVSGSIRPVSLPIIFLAGFFSAAAAKLKLDGDEYPDFDSPSAIAGSMAPIGMGPFLAYWGLFVLQETKKQGPEQNLIGALVGGGFASATIFFVGFALIGVMVGWFLWLFDSQPRIPKIAWLLFTSLVASITVTPLALRAL